MAQGMSFSELAKAIDDEMSNNTKLKSAMENAEKALNDAQAAHAASVTKVKDLYAQLHEKMSAFAPAPVNSVHTL